MPGYCPSVSHQPAPASPTTPRRKHRSNSYEEAKQLQQLAVDTVKSGAVKPADLAQLMRAYEVLERLKRDIRMKPKPRPVDVQPKVRKRPRALADARAWIELVPAQPGEPANTAQPADTHAHVDEQPNTEQPGPASADPPQS